MNSELYDDLAPAYSELVFSDVKILADGIEVDSAHLPQLKFRWNLFKKNVESFESLFSDTNTVVNPGNYQNFRLAIKEFVVIMEAKMAKPRMREQDIQDIHEIVELVRESYY